MTELADLLRERAAAGLRRTEGRVSIPGLRERVEILWDRWGVPHLYAQNAHDLFMAQGFVLSAERLFQLDFSVRFAAGRLAELVGDAALPFDRFARTVGWNRTAARIVQDLDDASWEILDPFVGGIRTWLEVMRARPVEYDVLQADPAFPEGRGGAEAIAAANVFLTWVLSANWDNELLRAEVAERLGWQAMWTLFPDLPTEPEAVRAGKHGGPAGRHAAADLLRDATRFPPGIGSNNWVVSGRRTATGKPLLANDPHLILQMPSIWFEIHLTAPGIDVRGVTLPWAPGVVIGHNDRIAWGITALSGDTQDLFLERLNEDGTATEYRGAWEPVARHREVIAVRGRLEPEVVEVRETRHGPILDSYMVGVLAPRFVPVRESYALRWVGAEHATRPSTLYRVNTATDFGGFRGALSDWEAPGLNFVYADVDGNIGYQAAGVHPVRRRGDGTMPVPGWTDEFEWSGFIPFEELPWSFNPEEGFLVTANNKVHEDSYPHLLGRDFMPPFRARRITELLTARDVHDVESFRAIHTDTVSLPAREIVPLLLELEPADDRQKQALGLLAEWDFDLAAESAAAAVYEVWCMRIAEVVLRPRLGEELYEHYFAFRQWSIAFQYQVLPGLLRFPTATWFGQEGRPARDAALREALDRALDELTAKLGEDLSGWSWGAIHRVRCRGRLAMLPGCQDLFTAGEAPWGGDEQTVQQGAFEPGSGTYDVAVVPSWRMVVDLSNLDASVGTQAVGQSGNPASRHYRDLFPVWAGGGYHPLPFSRAAVEAELESTEELVPGAPGPDDRAR